jgi:cubilin
MTGYILLLSVFGALVAPSMQAACDASRPDNITVAGTPIASPNYPNEYPSNSLCEYRFINTGSEALSPVLTFSEFVIEQSTGCTNDNVRIYDGWDTTAPLLGTYCGAQLHDSSISGSSTALYLVFTSDASVEQAPGFRAVFTAEDVACGDARPKILTAPGVIQSPGYGTGRYTVNSNCQWHIIAPAGQKVQFTFNDFATENCCLCDYLDIHDGDSLLSTLYGHWYGTDQPPNFTSRGNNVYLHFVSDTNLADVGFSIAFTFVTA